MDRALATVAYIRRFGSAVIEESLMWMAQPSARAEVDGCDSFPDDFPIERNRLAVFRGVLGRASITGIPGQWYVCLCVCVCVCVCVCGLCE